MTLLPGTRVLDLSQWLPGPMAGQLLADLGAAVCKVEPPGGDPMRALGPVDDDGVSAWYKAINAGKTVVRLDLKSGEGRDAFRRLVAEADILLESYRPGTLDKLGLGRDSLAALNPRLVHCALSGYGQTGPYALKGGHDINYMAVGGGLAASGPEAAPVMTYPPVADHASALQAVVVILAALLRRGGGPEAGRGAYLDVSLTETVLAWQALPMTGALRPGWQPTRGRALLNGGAACYRVYGTADGRFVTLGAIEAKFWRCFCEAVGRPGLVARQWEPFPQKALIAEVEAIFAGQPLAHWTALLGPLDCCFEPVPELAEVPDHPQVAARGQIRRRGQEPGEGPRVESLLGAWIDGSPPPDRAPLRELEPAAALAAWRRSAAV
ncbi:Crotonobetainyl-CoA:carnitine CoA-transferase CaiB [Tistlia consotensis]|uniref:Crotonobetainyl-CoA:carnitine CoA-transferase CaiB n=1 Tax=Tistlia consotensis USBA 355 TaxID=560819 RepID=A0A1Y6B8S1_9PROT|nr:CoA transferase [Tistlia consotensis]SME87861.1 Crotonobetainyl-CoA:carnitine CoA-transferase CaiB [Tistlia consotensis USBA 355]SNR24211.1 Crotonobetainyl-CoA:carnitine CoA-transferase CaiB [Tistlia consotensis]